MRCREHSNTCQRTPVGCSSALSRRPAAWRSCGSRGLWQPNFGDFDHPSRRRAPPSTQATSSS
ncbi:hypothetical protein TorRG33x02_088180 [Trema orientale]|uniref:Uncharacterized protein n=1 Tax=Trema orientale TaxID=63057 RepID=A0A2P5FC00_TREOI|nr:hypothetical protein TorRG33x02_088180 [Trema orientale]